LGGLSSGSRFCCKRSDKRRSRSDRYPQQTRFGQHNSLLGANELIQPLHDAR
jgi:hypothetical protein